MSQFRTSHEARVDASVGLPLSWYFDPEILEIERQHLFAAGPKIAGHTSLVKNDGDFFTLGGQQAGQVLVRSNGRPHLVSNTCRHRQGGLMRGVAAATT